MKKKDLQNIFIYLFCLTCILCYTNSNAQVARQRDVDSMFMDAKRNAFNDHQDKALLILDSILVRKPDYADIKIFKARINTWNKNYDTATRLLQEVLIKNPNYDDAISAMFDLKYWSDRYEEAEEYADRYLLIQPKSDEFHVKKAKARAAQEHLKSAMNSIDSFITEHPDSSKLAKEYKEALHDRMIYNSLTASYDLDYFDKTFNKQPWSLVSIYYSRQTKLFGSVIGRVNYANRFGVGGVQYEMDAYPGIAKHTYMYLNVGYSNYDVIFPDYRWGASVYRNLPHGLEVELGVRTLYFLPGSPIYIFTGSLGKYYRNWWFSFRPYITPDNVAHNVSRTFMLVSRYYWGGDADNYVGISVSNGYSPDDHFYSSYPPDKYQTNLLHSYKARIVYQRALNKRTFLNLRFAWEKDQLFYGYNNDFTYGFSLERRF